MQSMSEQTPAVHAIQTRPARSGKHRVSSLVDASNFTSRIRLYFLGCTHRSGRTSRSDAHLISLADANTEKPRLNKSIVNRGHTGYRSPKSAFWSIGEDCAMFCSQHHRLLLPGSFLTSSYLKGFPDINATIRMIRMP
ncbi:hypothetical protein [Paraburkholderia domus]|uniref:hypothetical protein n=1 Tax=Paraburkholderia domus TaxID=2793075 RepID=UPI0019120BDF|nr:hypothetical protein [Paraburkholderia domus]MBK5169401.1 hypothetical protein [Burkholderia sp. R-70211]